MRLSIVIPTFNRASQLNELLAWLDRELAGIDDDVVSVLVGDNASTDGTADLLSDWQGARAWLNVHRHAENVSGMPNLSWLVTHAPEADFTWILCDDDLPVPGALATVMELLRAEQPAWLFVPYSFIDRDGRPAHGVPEPGVVERFASSGGLYRAYHHWTTFLSAMIVRQDPLRAAALEVGIDNAYSGLLWAFRAALDGPCVVAPRRLIVGSLDISWGAAIDSFLTEHVVDLYDSGIDVGLTAQEFAETLDARYLHGDGVWALEMWRNVPFERLVDATRRFPHSRALRNYLWALAIERGDREALAVLIEAAQTAGAAAQADALVEQGEAAFAGGDYLGAVNSFREATAVAPPSAAAWNNLAVVLHSVGDPASAQVAVETALFVDPDDADARENRDAILGVASI